MKHLDRRAGRCPVCCSEHTWEFIELPDLPSSCNVLCATRQEALAIAKVAIRLAYCKDCAHIFNTVFTPDLVEYGNRYENALDSSPTFRSYASDLALRLVHDYALYSKTVLEIGCGNGNFLEMVCKVGGNKGIGFDRGAPGNSQGLPDQITFLRDFYSEEYSDYKANFVCCRHALEHIEKPIEFLSMLRRTMHSTEDTVLYFEVPNAMHMVRELGIWDVIHEHCSYYCANSLVTAFLQSGFDVLSVREEYGGEFLCIEAKPSDKPQRQPGHMAGPKDVAIDVVRFAEAHRMRIRQWQQYLAERAGMRQRVVVWGAGSKGVTFLNLLKAYGEIECIVDLNPKKSGMWTPGTAHPILSPSHLKQRPPDVVVVMNPVYKDEIRQMLHLMNLHPKVVTA